MAVDSRRALFIRYTRDGMRRRGSGLHIGGRFVLTADHCANGTDHTLVLKGREYPATVHIRSNTADVDVAVLVAPTLPELPTVECALVDRKHFLIINDCQALGYPSWKGTPERPELAQPQGRVPTAEGQRPTEGSPVQLMSFKILDGEVSGHPVPDGKLDEPTSVWAGMSGSAVLTADDQVIGVVRSHAFSEGGRSLTITPLEAISTLPAETANLIWTALGVADPTALSRLPTPALGRGLEREPVLRVPPLPAENVDRTVLIQHLVRLLTGQGDGDGAAPTLRRTVALRGAGGFGKTRLATMACHHAEVLTYFRDGIVWVKLGEQITGPELADRVNAVCWRLTGTRPPLTDPMAAGIELGAALKGRRILLVIDDVWSRTQLEPFLNGGPEATRLVTTRQQDALPVDAVAADVDAMNDQEARRLLTAGLGPVSDHLVDRVLAATGRWPVLLDLVHGAARSKLGRRGSFTDSLNRSLQRLLAHGPAALDAANPVQREAAVGTTIAASLHRLSAEQADRYVDLAVFPADTDIPQSVLERYWAAVAGWDPFQVEDFCGQLADLSLVQEYWLDPPRLRLHDVIRAYLVHRAGNYLPTRHAALLDSYRVLAQPSEAERLNIGVNPGISGRSDERTDWSQLPDREQYLWFFTGYHMHHAGLDSELAGCLHSATYLAGKLRRLGPGALETELLYLTDPVSVELLTVIRQSGHLLGPLEPPGSLEATLASRLAGRPALAPLAAQLQDLAPNGYLQSYAPLPDASPALKRVLVGGIGGFVALAVAPDGSWLASAGFDKTVRVWDPVTGTETHALTHTASAWTLTVDPDGSWLASAGQDGTVQLWDPVTGAATSTLTGHTGSVHALTVAPNGSWLASAGHDTTVRIWDPTTGALTHILTGHTAGVMRLVVAPDGSWLASAAEDGTVRIWDPTTGALTHVLTGHTDRIMALAVAPDGSWLASAGSDRTVRIWDPTAGAPTDTLTGHTNFVLALAVGLDGTWLASAGVDDRVRIWDPTDGTAARTLTGHTDQVTTVAGTSDGRWLASASKDTTVRVWDPATGEPLGALVGHTAAVLALAVAPDGSWLASAGDDATVLLWDPATGEPLRALVGHTAAVLALAVAPDGSWLASAGSDTTVRIWNLVTGRLTRTLTGHTDRIVALAVAPDGSWLASGSSDETVRIWNLNTPEIRSVRMRPPIGPTYTLTFKGPISPVNALAVAPDGRWLASAGYGAVLIWDPVTGALTHTLTGRTGGVCALAVAPDASWLAAASMDNTVRLWDPVTGALTHTLTGRTGGTGALAVAPDGSWLAFAGHDAYSGEDSTVRIWTLIPTPGASTALRVGGAINTLNVMEHALVAAGDHGLYWLRFKRA